MLSLLPGQSDQVEAARRPEGWFHRLAQEHPILMMFGIAILSNAAGSVFNFFYNVQLIVARDMTEAQQTAFWQVASPAYNLLAYGLCIGIMVHLIWPFMVCRRKLRVGETVPPALLAFCRRRVVNLPFLQVCVNFLGWIPGAVVFPWLVCTLGGNDKASIIWGQFIVSFLVSAVLTTVQTFFILEWFLINYFNPDFFQDARPADVVGVIRIPFLFRLILLWSAVAIMPLVAVVAVALNDLGWVAAVVGGVGALSGGLIFWIVGRDLHNWVNTHDQATQQIAQENLTSASRTSARTIGAASAIASTTWRWPWAGLGSYTRLLASLWDRKPAMKSWIATQAASWEARSRRSPSYLPTFAASPGAAPAKHRNEWSSCLIASLPCRGWR